MAEDILVYDIDICLPRMVVWGEHGREDSFSRSFCAGCTSRQLIAGSPGRCLNAKTLDPFGLLYISYPEREGLAETECRSASGY